MTEEKSGEFRGKTVEAAINAGLAALRLSRDEVEIEVIKPGSRGVLGIGAEDAVVRLTALRPARPAPRPEPATPVSPRVEPAPVSPKPEPRAEAVRPEPKAVHKPEVRQEAARPEPRPRPVAPPETAKLAGPQVTPPGGPAPAAVLKEKDLAAARLGQEFLMGLLERMGLRAKVEIVPQSDAEVEGDDRVAVLNIVGEDLGALIGRQNEVVSALEFITRLSVNQRSHIRSDFIVDVNGYRARRAEALRKLALRTAEQVIQTNRTMALEPMPPAERRIIHLALRDHPKVYTQSVGEGDRRKVTVIPKRDS